MQQVRVHAEARRGAMIVLVAVMLTILLVTVAFSVDVAFMQLARTELRTATDAAARAASEALSREQSIAAARQAAKNAAAANHVAGDPLVLLDDDIIFGHSNPQLNGVFTFNEGAAPTNAVQINGRRTSGSASGPVGLFFGGVLGPFFFEPTYQTRSVNLDRDICLVVDRSGSMNRNVVGGGIPGGADPCDKPHPTASRWAALSVAVQAFIDGVNQTSQEEKLALVSYSSSGSFCGRSYTDSDINVRLTNNYALVTGSMGTLSNNPIQGWTNISAGIDDGVVVLTDPARARPFAEKTMVLLTDGQQNRGRSAVDAAQDAAAQDIVIHTVTFSDEAEQNLMRQTAEAAGGRHFHAPNAAALEQIFREIALTLPVVLTQ